MGIIKLFKYMSAVKECSYYIKNGLIDHITTFLIEDETHTVRTWSLKRANVLNNCPNFIYRDISC